MELGRRIALQRAITGLKSKELAEMAGINQSYISSIENGKKVPTVQVLQKIARALGVTVSELLGEKSDLLTPGQRKLLIAAEGLSGAQLDAVINLILELKNGKKTAGNETTYLVAEEDET